MTIDTFGKALRHLRTKAGVPYKDVCRTIVGVNGAKVRDWESDVAVPNAYQLKGLYSMFPALRYYTKLLPKAVRGAVMELAADRVAEEGARVAAGAAGPRVRLVSPEDDPLALAARASGAFVLPDESGPPPAHVEESLPPPATFGQALRQRRLHHGLTASELAELLEVSESAVYSMEQDESAVQASTVQKLESLLGPLGWRTEAPAPAPAAAPPSRYAPAASKQASSWERDGEVLVELAKDAWNHEGPATWLLAELERRTGRFRTAAAVNLRLRSVAGLKLPPLLARGIDAIRKEASKKKDALLHDEAKRLRAFERGEAPLPEMVSIDACRKLIGNDTRREGLQVFVDRETGVLCLRSADVLARRKELVDEHGGELPLHGRMSPVRTPKAEAVAAMLAAAAGPRGATMHELERASHVADARAAGIVTELVAAGKLAEHPGRREGSKLYALAGAPAPRREPKVAPEAPAKPVPAAPSPAPSEAPKAGPAGIDHALSADIYRAVKAGELTPEQGAAMLRALAKEAK